MEEMRMTLEEGLKETNKTLDRMNKTLEEGLKETNKTLDRTNKTLDRVMQIQSINIIDGKKLQTQCS